VVVTPAVGGVGAEETREQTLPGETPTAPAEPAPADLADAIFVVTPERWRRQEPDEDDHGRMDVARGGEVPA